MPGPVGALHHLRLLDLGHSITEAVAVQFRLAGHEDELGPFLPQHRQVVLERAWILCQVGRIVELRRVDEDADERSIVFRPATSHQREMALVQRAHRRHEAKRQAGANLREPLLAPRGSALEDRRHE